MSIAKFIRDIEQYFRYSTDAEPTTQQEFQEAMKNWIKTEEAIVDCILWQPETTYQVGDTVRTPSLSKQELLLCITAGQSGAAEPDYTDVSSNDEITDGTVVWRVQTVASQENTKQYTDTKVADAVSAINTRLGTVLEASGSSTTASANTTLCSITTHPAGTWLIIGFVAVNYSGTSFYANIIRTENHNNSTTRNADNAGGGNTNVFLTELDENEVVSLVGYQVQRGTIRGILKMVQLA